MNYFNKIKVYDLWFTDFWVEMIFGLVGKKNQIGKKYLQQKKFLYWSDLWYKIISIDAHHAVNVAPHLKLLFGPFNCSFSLEGPRVRTVVTVASHLSLIIWSAAAVSTQPFLPVCILRSTSVVTAYFQGLELLFFIELMGGLSCFQTLWAAFRVHCSLNSTLEKQPQVTRAATAFSI